MTLRPIIRIDEAKCDGCGQCVTGCAEGALKIIDGKARLVSDKYCDGLGACIGECPTGALTIEMREADAYDEAAVLAAGGDPKGLAQTHPNRPVPLHPAHAPHAGGCPGSMSRQFQAASTPAPAPAGGGAAEAPTRLTHWPIQLHLIHPGAPQYQGADVLLAADCAPFAMAGFHEKMLAGRSLIIACPKLDDKSGYMEKLEHLFARAQVKSLTVARMEVPCCGGLLQMVLQARESAGSDAPVRDVVVGVRGDVLSEREVGTNATGAWASRG
jgi:Pyruvate/2-oxoacid:ferredoxin oxidoreductase delta subunit